MSNVDLKKVKPKVSLEVSHGTNRGEAKNEDWTDAKLFRLLAEPFVDTSITEAKYRKLKETKEGNTQVQALKARAGWVKGGHYANGKRKAMNLLGVSVGMLDLDNITHDQLDQILEGDAPISEFRYFVHTTRSHRPIEPRVRIVVPFSRTTGLDEANAIMRYLAQMLNTDPDEGINIPDQVSFRQNQISYRPSISRGQEFWWHFNEGDVLDPDEFLEEHPNWQDVTTLPTQDDEDDASVADPNKKFEDPRDKPGLIGAWCRTYDVEEVIANDIPDVYTEGEAGAGEIARYTYVAGSNYNGAIVYDDGRILYSNHGSDPIDGGVNAWDLCRIHKFGHLDADAHANTNPGNMPSQKAMEKYAEKDPDVMAELNSHWAGAFEDPDEDFDDEDEDDDDDQGDEIDLDDLGLDDDEEEEGGSVADLFDDYDDDDEGEDEEPRERKKDKKKKKDGPDLSWMADGRKKKDKDGNETWEQVLHNASLICANDPRISSSIAYNLFTHEPLCTSRIKAKHIATPSQPVDKRLRHGRAWEDKDDISIKLICSAPARLGGYEVDFPRNVVEEAVLAAGSKNQVHPVRDWMEECHQKYLASGKATEGAIERIPQDYLDRPDNAFHRESSRALMLGMVARIYEPGCKFDLVTILRGAQGGAKGYFWRTLATSEFFIELGKNFDRTDRMIENMRGALVCEMGEMAGLRADTAEEAKEFITRREDKHRLAYARREGKYPRQSVLVGTSNLDEILHDPTGNRRFIIWVSENNEKNPIDIERLERERDMLFGEAVDVYKAERKAKPHGDLWLDLKTQEARDQRDALANRFRARTATEVLAEVIRDHLDTPVPQGDAESDPVAAKFDSYDEGDDERLVVRSMVTAQDIYNELHETPEFRQYRNATVAVVGRAMSKIPGWTQQPRTRRHGRNVFWYTRDDGPGLGTSRRPGPLWIAAPEEPEDDDIDLDDLGLDDL